MHWWSESKSGNAFTFITAYFVRKPLLYKLLYKHYAASALFTILV